MTNGRNIKVKSLIAKWLLFAVFFAGIFASVGAFGQSSFQQQKVRTELVYSNKPSAVDRVFACKFQFARAQQALVHTSVLYNNFVLVYDRLSKVKFDLLTRQAVLITTSCRFHLVKTIPQSSDENISFFLG